MESNQNNFAARIYNTHTQAIPTSDLRSGDQIIIGNVAYVVERVLTQSGHANEGWLNLALLMEQNGPFAQLTLRRPRGKALHIAMLSDNGMVGSLTKI